MINNGRLTDSLTHITIYYYNNYWLTDINSPDRGRMVTADLFDLDPQRTFGSIDLQVWILERREREQKGYRRKDNIVSVTVGDRERVCVGGNREREGQGVKKR